MQRQPNAHPRHRMAGFVVSTEMMLIALVLGIGLITGWVKLRDQSLAEIQDAMAAIDTYILGSAPLWQTGGTRWIVGGTVVEPSSTGPVSESWDNGADPPFAAPAAEETGPSTHVFRNQDGFLVYGSAPTPSTSISGAGEAP